MNDFTPQEKQRIVTEFSSLESKLDTVLFARSPYEDEVDQNGMPIIRTVAGVGAVGAGAYGVNSLRKRGIASTAGAGLGWSRAAKSQGFLKDVSSGTRDALKVARSGRDSAVSELMKRLKSMRGLAKAAV